METWNERLAQAMDARGKIAADLSRVTKKKAASVSDWLSGKTKMMEADNAAVVCSFLRINHDWLFFGKGSSGLETVYENTEPGPDIQGRVPLVSWVQAGAWSEIIDISTFPQALLSAADAIKRHADACWKQA